MTTKESIVRLLKSNDKAVARALVVHYEALLRKAEANI